MAQSTEAAFWLNGVWVVADWLARNGVSIRNGRSNWASKVDPARLAFSLDNRSGDWSPDNEIGSHFGHYKLNIPTRFGVGRGDPYATCNGVSADVVSTPDIPGTGGGSPTAPAHVDVTESEETTATTAHTFDVSATVAAGDRLLAVVVAGHESLTASADLDDWTLVVDSNLYVPWHAVQVYEIGPVSTSEASALAGSTIGFATTANVKSSCQVVRTSGARAGGLGVAYDFAIDSVKTFSDAPDPPSLTVDWGADEQRWYAFAIYGSAGKSVSTYPAGYTSMADGHVSALVQIASAHATTSAATEDPGAYALTGDENWLGFTFAYRAEEDESTDGVLDIIGDIDVRWEIELHEDLVDLIDSGERVRVAHKSSGLDGWEIEMFGLLGQVDFAFNWYDSSGVRGSYETLDTGSHPPLTLQHDRIALAVTLDVNNGAGDSTARFYWTDRLARPWAEWTEIGDGATGEGVTSIGANDAPLRLWGNPADQAHRTLAGKGFGFELRDGIDGTVVADPDFTAQAVGASGFTDAAGRVWTVGAGGEITDQRWRFHGELVSLPVRYSTSGDDVWAPITANGLFRRLKKGQRLESAIRRAIIRSATNLVQYWPMEETGGGFVTRFGAAVGTSQIVVTVAVPDTGASKTFLASSALPTPGDGVWTVDPDAYTPSTEAWQIRWLQHIPSSFADDNLFYFRVVTSDMVWEIEYRTNTGGQFRLHAYRGFDEVYTSAWAEFDATGKSFRMQLWVRQNGADVDVNLEAQEPGEPLGGGITVSSAVAGSAGTVGRVVINKDSDVDGWAFGHLTVQDAVTASTELATELDAYAGELAADRIMRLCREEGIKYRIEGDPADTEPMGPQLPATLMALLEECAATDLGILHEPREVIAIGYRTRVSMIGQEPRNFPIDNTGLVGWWTTADVMSDGQQTIPDRSGVTGDATRGPTSAATAADPDVALGHPTRLDPDGVDDYLLIPYTPTVTATTGALTILLAGYWNDTATDYGRLLSMETASNDGISIHSDAAAVALPKMAIGGSGGIVGQAVAGSNMTADERFVIGLQIDAGTIAAYRHGDGLNGGWSTAAIGTVGNGAGKLFTRADDVDANLAVSSATDVVIVERVLTEAEADTLAEWIFERHQDRLVKLDYEAGQVARPLELDRDDQGFSNDVEVENNSGSVARAVLDDGSDLSVSEPPTGAGRYDKTFRVNGLDSRLQDLADSRLALASVDEPRVSDLQVALNHDALVAHPDLTDNILAGSLGDLTTIWNNLPTAITGEIRQIVQGTRERISNHQHHVAYLTSPSKPWGDEAAGDPPPVVTPPPAAHSVGFRTQHGLATPGAPAHVLTALGYHDTDTITRAQLDGILDDWVDGTGGTTHAVTSKATWNTAIGAAVPGDLVRCTASFDPVGALVARGDLYGIGGSNLTASSGDGGDPGLPIITTCADGVVIDDNNTSSNAPVLDLVNCRHVWAVGFNVREGQFGIRGLNWGGSEGFPAYVAYCDVAEIGDAGIAMQGWWQLITSSGGTPPAGAGNTWGFSEHLVIESNNIDGVGKRSSTTGEATYLGRGSTPGWVSYVRDAWLRGNTSNDWTSDGHEIKPGCVRIYETDNDIHVGHAVSGAPFGSLYVAAALDTRPAFFDVDPEVWLEGNRLHDSDLTNVDGSSVHIMGYIGLSGMRIANNILWAKPETGTHPMWRVRNEHGTNDTEALAQFRNDPTWLINNTLWGDDTFSNAGYGSPFVGPMPGTIDFDLRNNVCDQASPATGEVDASASDFIDTVPAIGVAGDADWDGAGHGSAFDLALDSALIGAGEDISDVSFYIDRDISDRQFVDKTAPNPGAFQPHPANLA